MSGPKQDPSNPILEASPTQVEDVQQSTIQDQEARPQQEESPGYETFLDSNDSLDEALMDLEMNFEHFLSVPDIESESSPELAQTSHQASAQADATIMTPAPPKPNLATSRLEDYLPKKSKSIDLSASSALPPPPEITGRAKEEILSAKERFQKMSSTGSIRALKPGDVLHQQPASAPSSAPPVEEAFDMTVREEDFAQTSIASMANPEELAEKTAIGPLPSLDELTSGEQSSEDAIPAVQGVAIDVDVDLEIAPGIPLNEADGLALDVTIDEDHLDQTIDSTVDTTLDTTLQELDDSPQDPQPTQRMRAPAFTMAEMQAGQPPQSPKKRPQEPSMEERMQRFQRMTSTLGTRSPAASPAVGAVVTPQGANTQGIATAAPTQFPRTASTGGFRPVTLKDKSQQHTPNASPTTGMPVQNQFARTASKQGQHSIAQGQFQRTASRGNVAPVVQGTVVGQAQGQFPRTASRGGVVQGAVVGQAQGQFPRTASRANIGGQGQFQRTSSRGNVAPVVQGTVVGQAQGQFPRTASHGGVVQGTIVGETQGQFPRTASRGGNMSLAPVVQGTVIGQPQPPSLASRSQSGLPAAGGSYSQGGLPAARGSHSQGRLPAARHTADLEIEVDLPPEPPREASPQETEQAKRVFSLMMRSYQAFEFYPINHSIVQNLSNDLFTALSKFFALRPTLDVDLDRFSVRYFGKEILRDESVLNNFVFILFTDGIRRLSFYEGLVEEEFVRFFKVLNECSKARSRNEDSVTLLWEHQFEHIRYYLVEDLYEVCVPNLLDLFDELDEDNLEWTDKLADSLQGVDHMNPKRSIIDNSLRAIEALNRADLGLNELEIKELFELFINEREKLMFRFFRVIALVLGNNDASEEMTVLVELLNRIQPMLRELDDVNLLVDCLSLINRLNSLLQKNPDALAASWRSALQEALSQSQDTEMVEYLAVQLDNSPGNAALLKAIQLYFSIYNPAKPGPLLAAHQTIIQRATRQKWTQLLVEKYRPNPRMLVDQLHSEDDKVARYTCILLGELAAKETLTFLEQAGKHANEQVRVEALRAISKMVGIKMSKRLASILRLAFIGKNSEARVLAIRTLPNLEHQSHSFIIDLFNKRMYENWEIKEVRLFIRSLLKLVERYPKWLQILGDTLLADYKGRFGGGRQDILRVVLEELRDSQNPHAFDLLDRLHEQGSRHLKRVFREVIK